VFRRQADGEKRQLEATLNELEVRVRESILENARRRDRSPSPGREGSDGYEQQIEFLNSVIVDMQKKNDELRCRVQVLEEIGMYYRDIHCLYSKGSFMKYIYEGNVDLFQCYISKFV
jgi:hypothetical protein